MEQLISMYAALQKYPVAVSYPNGQICAGDFNHAHGYDHDFVTIYEFGPYKLENNELARSKHFIKGYGQELIFTEPGTTLYIPVPIRKHLVGLDKDYVELSKAIQTKANGKNFKNPFEETINDSVYNLQFYLTELAHTHSTVMNDDEIQETITKLDEIKKRLLLTQNINYSEKSK
ncbi:MAG: hypothetical protein J6Y07_01470 [Alphaproteobacteria bacterium]|nr:hypothetical protein [Alphaproteobacteria bacterium]